MEAINLADLYQLPLLDWASIEDKLRSGVTQAPDTGGPKRHTCWLSTINADGSPHVNGVGALWADGCHGAGHRRARRSHALAVLAARYRRRKKRLPTRGRPR